LNDIRAKLSSGDISDLRRAQNKMVEYEKFLEERAGIAETVEGFTRKMSELSQKIAGLKDASARKQELTQNIQILKQAAVILGISTAQIPVRKPRAKTVSAHPHFPSSASGFQLSLQQRERINQLRDKDWYGSKFGHAGVMRAKSQDPDFKTNADFLQAMIDRTYSQKADQIPGKETHGLLRDISAVRNRIASFPVWDGEWQSGDGINFDALEEFIVSREQAALQLKAS